MLLQFIIVFGNICYLNIYYYNILHWNHYQNSIQAMNPYSIVGFICFFYIITFTNSQFTLANTGQSLSSSLTLDTNVLYYFNFTLNKLIPSTSIVKLTFPAQFVINASVLTNCQATITSSVAPSSASCYSQYSSGLGVYSIIFTGLYSTSITQSFLGLKFSITNPWAQASQKIDTYILNSANSTVESVSFFVSFTASSMSNCSIVSASNITGNNVSQVVTFNPSKNLIAGCYLLITIPKWFIGSTTILGNLGSSSLSCSGLVNSDASGLSCGIANLNTTVQVININGFILSNKSSPGSISLQSNLLRNPWNLQAFGSIKFQIHCVGTLDYVSQRCSNIYNQVYQTNNFTLVSFNLTQSIISKNNTNIRLLAVVKNPCPKNKTLMQISYPSSISFVYSGTSTIFSQNSTATVFTNVANVSDITTGSISLFNFAVLTPPSTRAYMITFTTLYYDSSTSGYYSIDSTQMSYQNAAGVMTAANLTLGTLSINKNTSYHIVFTTINALTSGSFIQIIFPSDSVVDPSATCSVNITNTSSCSKSNQNITIQINGTVSAGSIIKVIVTVVLNGPDAVTSSSFQIYTYYDNLYDSLVDQLTSGLNVTFTINTITIGSITLANYTTYASTSYSFSLQLIDSIPQGGYLQIDFPSSVTYVTGSLILNSATFSIATCTINELNSTSIQILNCFLSSNMTTLSINFNISGIINPTSFKPSSSFKITTFSTLSMRNIISTGLTVTMNVSSVIGTILFSPLNSTVYAVSRYNINFTHSVPHAINDYVLIDIDPTMSLSTSLNCAGITGISTISCTKINSTQIKIVYLSVPTTSIQYYAQNFTNYQISNINVQFTVKIYDNSNYLMEIGTTSAQYTSAKISSVTVSNDDKIALYQSSQISLTINGPFSLLPVFTANLASIIITIPSGFTINGNSTCISSIGICAASSSSQFTVTSAGLSLSNFVITLKEVVLPYFALQSQSFSIAYQYNSNNVSTIDTEVVVLPYCTSPCQACNITKIACLNCLPAPNTLIYYDSDTFTCLNQCINGKYPDLNDICLNCTSPCLYCTSLTTCTKCVANKWLYNSTCQSICPDTFYNASNGICQPCQSPCDNCKTSTQCLSCLVGFYTNLSCVNASSCPNGTYANVSTNVCENCISPCSYCTQIDTCTKCVSNTWLYNSSCYGVCPDTLYNASNGTCASCQSPCNTCLTISLCLTCVSNKYYYNFTCLLASSCPNGTYANVSTNICENCISPCSYCTEIDTCTKCVSNTWLYNSSCYAVCPDTLYNASNGTCASCQSPCNTCLTISSCLTCVSNKYYYNFTCLLASSCPNGTYANSSTMICQTCLSPCKNCMISFSNCTTCQTGYFFYQNNCSLNCPAGTYKNSPNCTNCSLPCTTCSNSTYCLSCATNYQYNGTCILASSCPNGTFANSTTMMCQTCPAGCISCLNSTNCSSCNTTFYVFYQFQCLITCPNGTYKSGFTCQNCDLSCKTCINSSTTCLSCNSTTYLYNNSCGSSCPNGTYINVDKCSNCQSICFTCLNSTSCSSCNGSLYLTSNTCLTNCPLGAFKDIGNICTSCTNPCSQCNGTTNNCTSCVFPNLLYNNNCDSTTCPSQYFNINQVCVTCPNCNNCLDSFTCTSCKPGYFMYLSVCYGTCPSTAPIGDLVSQTCVICDSSCQSCAGFINNCTSCSSGLFLFAGSCFSSCPSGYIQQSFTRTCQAAQLSSIFYFPCLFSVLGIFVIVIYSKLYFSKTEAVTILTASIGIFSFISWIILGMVLYLYQHSLDQQLVSLFFLICIAAVLSSILIGIFYNVYLYFTFDCDDGYESWKQYSQINPRIHKIILSLSIFNFLFYRFLYGRLFNRVYFSIFFSDGDKMFSSTFRVSIATLFLNYIPMISVSFLIMYKKQKYDQTVYSAADTMILAVLTIILLLIDGSKSGEQFFDQMRKDMPFIKDKRGKYLQANSICSQIDFEELQLDKRRVRTSVGQKEQEEYFRKITCVPNINKYGHLNQFQTSKKQQTKSLPQYNDFKKLPQYDPHHDHQDLVINDLLFQQQEQEAQRVQREKERLLEEMRKQKELQAQKEIEKIKKIQQLRKQQQERRQKQRLQQERLSKLLQDQKEQQDLEFVDIAAIQKAEGKNKNRKSPLQFLNKCKKVDDKPVDPKALKKLQDVAKKNGIDPQFFKQTFGIQKHHNQDLLNAIIDKHNHVNREAVKQMFDENNNAQILQQLFGKNSTMDPQKLKQIMNHPNSQQLLKKLMNKQEGILNPQIAKQLFDKNSKFSKQFVENLLSGETKADQEKLKQILKNPQNKTSALKALKKIGGNNLQNEEIIQNMLGKQSHLDPDSFVKVSNQLSAKAIQNLFKVKSPQNDAITKKILNNKKLNLKNLATIFQDEQILQELGQTLSNGDPQIQQNIVNLFKNCENVDPQLFKQLLQNPTLVKKLLSNPIDPTFLANILQKGSNVDLSLLQKTLQNMDDENIRQIFQFTGQKNIDYNSLAKLFEANKNTDPQLVKQMMDPKLISQVYAKNNNDPKILQKLVQKGSKFDKEMILGIYGKGTQNAFNAKQNNFQNNQNDFGINRVNMGSQTMSQYTNYNFNKTKDDFQSERGEGSKGIANNQLAMSRTDGGIMGFLNPLNLNTKKSKQKGNGKSFQEEDDLDQGQEQFDMEDNETILEQSEDGSPTFKRRKKKSTKKPRKKLTDIRLPAQQIYLQRIQAPHQKKVNFKKKKRTSNSNSQKKIMDEDNDVFDLDF